MIKEKHGTCAVSNGLSTLSTEYQYFDLAISWHSQLNTLVCYFTPLKSHNSEGETDISVHNRLYIIAST